MSDNPTSIEMFSGAGGMALGVARAGFRHLALNEIDEYAVSTLRANLDRLSGAELIDGDSRQIDWSRWRGDVRLLAAGAPCQPFSIAGDSKGHHDERNLFPEVIRAVREIRPDAVLLENVRGLGRKSFRPYFDYVLRQLAAPDLHSRAGESWRDHDARLKGHSPSDPADRYVVHGPRMINAADHGVAQVRQRLFVVAFRGDRAPDDWAWPALTHGRDLLVWEQIHGVYWRQRDLPLQPSPKASMALVGRLENSQPPVGVAAWRTLRDAIDGLPDPRTPAADDIDGHVHVPGGKTYDGHTGNLLDWPAKTVKAGVKGRPGGEGIVHEDNGGLRLLTVRETARLQAFPDHWHIAGPRSRALRQLGNAVPVTVAQHLAEGIANVLTDTGTATTKQRQKAAAGAA